MVTATDKSLAALEWIRDNAERLRESGVTRIKAGNIEADIAPEMPAPVEPTQTDSDRLYGVDPLDDPSTFPDGRLPTFQRRQ